MKSTNLSLLQAIMLTGFVSCCVVQGQTLPPTYVVTTIAGSGPTGFQEGRNRGDGGPATEARLESPVEVVFDPSGDLLIRVVSNSSSQPNIRKIDKSGIITSVEEYEGPLRRLPNGKLLMYRKSWNSLIEYSADGSQNVIKIPRLGSIRDVVAAPNGDYYFMERDTIYLLESGDDRYREIKGYELMGITMSPGGQLYAFGRRGIEALGPDRQLRSVVRAMINGQVWDAEFDAEGNLFFTEEGYTRSGGSLVKSCTISRMAPNGTIHTIAGGQTCAFVGENVPGLQAGFFQPFGLTLDQDGNIYVADAMAHRIRKLTPAGSLEAGPQVSAITNGASFLETPTKAPGTVFTIFGKAMGPATLATAEVANGMLPTSIAGVRIMFNGVAAPLLYVSGTQCSGIVPFGLPAGSAVSMTVEYKSSRSLPRRILLSDSTPALFTANGSGQGAVAALNQDGTLNSASQPARAGEFVILYATGLGDLSPTVKSGAIAGEVPSRVMNQASVCFKGTCVAPAYAGTAPGLVAGVYQVNVQVPKGLWGTVGVYIYGAASTATNIYVK